GGRALPGAREACVALTGEALTDFDQPGGATRLLEVLTKRWSGPAVPRVSGHGQSGRFTALFQGFEPATCRAASVAGASADLARDAVQHVFMDVWMRGPDFWAKDHKAVWFQQKATWYVKHVQARKENRHVSLSSRRVSASIRKREGPVVDMPADRSP